MRKILQKKEVGTIRFVSYGRMVLLLAFIFNLSIVSAQNTRTTGSVVNADGEPLAGAMLVDQSSNAVVMSGADGSFAISVAGNATLTVTLTGYTAQNVAVNNRSSIVIVMEEDVNQLDEVIVVGYGTMRKSDITGSISSVKSDEITQAQTFSVVDGLRGRVAGVNIFSNSGQPGDYSRILVRGISTINSDFEPLYVVDGTIMTNGMQTLNPNDIESMEVLKDASATAIYGARGANGVIIITTKRGKTNGEGIDVSYSGSVTLSSMARKVDVLNAEEWQQVFMMGLKNSNDYKGTSYDLNRATHFTDPRYFDSNGNALYDTDWQDEATRNSVSHNHQVSIQQSAKNSSFGAFFGFTDQQGIMKESWMKRATTRMTFDANPKKWLNINSTVSVNHSWQNDTGNAVNDGGQNALRRMWEMPAWYPVYNPDGTWADDNTAVFPRVLKRAATSTTEASYVTFAGENGANPLHYLEEVKYRRNYTQVMGNLGLTFHIAPHLDFQTRFGLNFRNYVRRYYGPKTVHDFGRPNGSATQENSQNLFWSEESFLTYNNTFNDKHRLNAMLGMSWEEQTGQNFNASASMFTDDYFQYWNLGAGTNRPSVGSGRSRSAMNSYFFRAAYSYDDRYSLTFTSRADGSSKFGANNKFAFFPSAGFAWTASNESFMENADFIDLLRLHTSYGLTGNSGISNYQSLSTISTGTTVIDNSTVSTAALSRMANKDLKWETTAMLDIGFEASMFRNRLSAEVSYYHKYTRDLLYSRPIPYETGFASVMSNIGEVSNRGLDLMLRGYPVRNDNFAWQSSINLNWNKSRVEKLGEKNEPNYANWGGYAIGDPLSAFYLYPFLGIESDKSLSTFGRSIIGSSREYVGKGLPDWTGSFINDFSYKNFDLTIDFQFTMGVEVYQDFLHSTQSRFLTSGLKTLLNGWTPENTDTRVQMIFNRQYGDNFSSHDANSSWIADGSYLRLNMIQLGYTFTPEVLNRAGIKALRVYATGGNLWLLCSDDYLGFDPENSSKHDNRFGQNVEFFSYPKARTFTMGLNITF